MSAITPPALGIPAAKEPQQHGDNYLTHSRGIMSWLFSLDHKRIGLVYMIGVLSAFFVGGVFAILLRTKLLTPGLMYTNNKTAEWNFYNHAFTFHGAVMVFLFIIPAIPAILGNFILPIMLGAKDVAFPRLNLGSLWCWIGGAIFFTYVLLGGILNASLGWHLPGGMGLDTGWTFYTPYSTGQVGVGGTPYAHATDGTIVALLGVFVLGFSSI